MPTPIAHSLAGIILYQARPERQHRLLVLVLLLVGANLPDLDFIPGMLMGNADRFHHGPSHSLLVGLALSAVAGALTAWRAGAEKGWRVALALAGGYLSHVVLDAFCIDTRPPYGVPLFWPLWDGAVASPVELFMDIRRDRDTALFFGSLFQPHNLRAAGWELGLMTCVLAIVSAVRRWRLRPRPVRTGERHTEV